MALIFSKPVAFADAITSREIRSLLPTDLSSAELSHISADILERAKFSARITNAEHLQVVFDAAEDFDAGRINFATARLRVIEFLRGIGYEPEDGHEGGLRDFSSQVRIDLQLQMASQQAAGYGDWKYNQQAVILDRWPAQELFRAAPAMQPRDWHTRWSDAGGTIFEGGRMIALRDDRIWTRISRFGTPYAPFDFNSHMRTRLVDRTKAMALHIVNEDGVRVPAPLIDRNRQIQPQDRGFNDDLRYPAKVRAAALRQVLIDEGYNFITGADGAEYLTIGGVN